MFSKVFRAADIPLLLGFAKSVAEHAPEIAEAATAVAAPGLLPLAVLAPPIIEHLAKRREDRPEAEALIELYRESLLEAVHVCAESLPENAPVTAEDKGLLDLWQDGLKISTKRDSFWAAMLDEEIPAITVRLISIDIARPTSYWPLLRAQLARWTDWFRYRRTAGAAYLGLAVAKQPLALSPYLERYLAINLTAALLAKFRPEIASGKEEVAFRNTLLASLSHLGAQVSPLDPLKPITEFPTAQDARHEVQLLDARYRAIPYIGREGDVEDLWKWLVGPDPVSFQVVVGRGGSGKTRIAYRLLELLEERAPFTWHAGLLEPQRFPEALANERFRRWRGRQPTLIVIDYAASCSELQRNVIPELASSGFNASADAPPLRFLLLERGADSRQGWYANLLRAAGSREQEFFPHPPLKLAGLDPEQQLQLLDVALDALHRFNRQPRLKCDPGLAKRLGEPRMADPLVLFMAAMVAQQRQNLNALDLDRVDLAREVAKHEYRRLERLAHAETRTNFLLLHMAAYVTLTGHLTSGELKSACEQEKASVEGDSPWSVQQLVDVLATRGSPAMDRAFAVDPITPDAVGEAFLLQVLQEHNHEAEETVLRASARKLGSVTRTLVRLSQDFAPDPAALEEQAGENQKWALGLLTYVLERKTEALSDEDFWAIHAALPVDTIAMVEPARNFYRAIAAQRDNGVAWAAALVAYSTYESKLGNRGQALRSSAEAVQHYRELAKVKPNGILPDLAGALNNQAIMQTKMGQRAEALGSIAEAVQHYRELVKANPDAFLPELAMALNNQAARQSEMGHRAEALGSIAEAVQHYRELVKTNPDAFLPDFAMSLNNQAAIQSGMGQRADALGSIAEAVQHYRELVKANPDAFLPDLAMALNNQATMQSAMGQRLEALGSIAEAVQHYRELVKANPDAFLPELAMALNNQATRQSEMGQRAEALPSVGEAVQHYRALVKANPGAFLPNLANALNNQATRQSALGQRVEALPSIAEAVRHYRELVKANPDAFLPDLANALSNQATMQSALGRPTQALGSIAEAVQIRSELVKANPDAFLPDLALSHGAWGRVLLASGNPAEAAERFAEGIRLITPLAFRLPEAHFDLALRLARGYHQAYSAAGLTPDPELTWPLDALKNASEAGHSSNG